MIRLDDGKANAEIALVGAELRTWRVGDVDLIWTPDAAIWSDTAPILFPVVGWTRDGEIRVDGRVHPLGLHGFARRMPFRVVEQAPTRVLLRLEADDETRARYPFDWRFDVEFALDDGALSTRLTICNTGMRTMPYACGLHPGLRWPFAGGASEDYAIVFAAPEVPRVPVISSAGLFTRETREIAIDGCRLPLSKDLMAREALCFLGARSRGLRFVHRSGATLNVALEDFPHIALWSKSPGRFLSIEAWTGHGDLVDADGDLSTKPSMRHLAPGATGEHAARFAYVGAAT